MKSIVAALAVLASVPMIGAAAPAPAVAPAPVQTTVYQCIARSPSAYGVWRAYSLNTARRNALYQCALRTPGYETCVITRCDYETRY
jgi:hypothetical protein